MAVRLRLTRRGKKKQPTYRVVAADSRSPRDGRFIEIIGFYDPRQEPSEIRIDNDKAVKWLRVGAQPSERVRKLLDVSGAWAEFKGEPPPAAAAKANTAATAEAPRVVTRARGDEAEEEAEETEAAEEVAAEKESAVSGEKAESQSDAKTKAEEAEAKDEEDAKAEAAEAELAEAAVEEADPEADAAEAEAEASEAETAEETEENKQ